MLKLEKEFIQKLTNRMKELHWCKWIVRRSSGYGYFPRDREERFFVQTSGIKTILPESLFRVEIRLFAKIDQDKDWMHYPFNPKRHDFVYEIKIINDMQVIKGKRVIEFTCWKGDKGLGMVSDLFEEVKKLAVSLDLQKKKQSQYFLRKVINAL